jgi:N-formylglutamate amidohydrolase
MDPFKVIRPKGDLAPILLSVPHCGIEFPPEIKAQYKQDLIESPDDTDWFVHDLYNFASDMGITMIHAIYSRWVIDLNRDPQSKPLYSDGRIITSLCPSTTFLGDSIYNDRRDFVDDQEIIRRTYNYYNPYHLKIQELLNELKHKFGKVLLWDCHSIRQVVPTIHQEKFPDLILGNADGASASSGLIESAIANLRLGEYSFSHNYPFKGGYITRYFGKPSENQHALQLEMTKVNYMNDEEQLFDAERAEKMRAILKTTLNSLTEVLK